MVKYIINRVLMGIVTLLAVAAITFFIMNLVPGGPFLSEKAPSQAVLDALEAKYGLDKPLYVQFWNWLTGILQGDFGVSFKMQKNRPVLDIILDMFPVSAKLGLLAMLWAVIVGIVLGSLSGYYRGSALDSVLRVVTTGGVALPTFVTASVLLVVFAGGVWNIFPSMTGSDTSFKSMFLPVLTLGLNPMCNIAKYTRSSMLDVLGQDYIRTARAKGLASRKVIFKHALRNALIPIITYVGPMFAFVLTGGFVVEQLFNIPGLGRYFVQSINNRDYMLIMGTTMFLAILLIGVNILVDIAYKIIDPRIHLGKEDA